ncbi:hypothetical protein NW768_008607 [Fusarium equiseti]|uniref:Uncharacterized protein n=1 Tax=Fusarium equiseti TaxID=61235 RepID=A0ABQ8R4I7_FUSEQ|nr:hypothetical protein NW768_008607 [Fusarium equiseti]
MAQMRAEMADKADEAKKAEKEEDDDEDAKAVYVHHYLLLSLPTTHFTDGPIRLGVPTAPPPPQQPQHRNVAAHFGNKNCYQRPGPRSQEE